MVQAAASAARSPPRWPRPYACVGNFSKPGYSRSGAPIGVANWQTNPNVDISDDLPESLRDELGDLREVRDRLASHVADAADRVEARLLEAGEADRASDEG